MDERDWTPEDAVRILALPLDRVNAKRLFTRPDTDLRELVYSNGTQADIALDNALELLDHGPVLRRVLEAGVRALGAELEPYIVALYSGDRERIVAVERKARG